MRTKESVMKGIRFDWPNPYSGGDRGPIVSLDMTDEKVARPPKTVNTPGELTTPPPSVKSDVERRGKRNPTN